MHKCQSVAAVAYTYTMTIQEATKSASLATSAAIQFRDARCAAIVDAYEVPEHLFHGTLASNLASIQEHGLSGAFTKTMPGCVHLAADEADARMYGNNFGEGPIVVLAVALKALDQSKLGPDREDLKDLLEQADDVRSWDEVGWLESLKLSGQCTYEGSIAPAHLLIASPCGELAPIGLTEQQRAAGAFGLMSRLLKASLTGLREIKRSEWRSRAALRTRAAQLSRAPAELTLGLQALAHRVNHGGVAQAFVRRAEHKLRQPLWQPLVFVVEDDIALDVLALDVLQDALVAPEDLT